MLQNGECSVFMSAIYALWCTTNRLLQMLLLCRGHSFPRSYFILLPSWTYILFIFTIMQLHSGSERTRARWVPHKEIQTQQMIKFYHHFAALIPNVTQLVISTAQFSLHGALFLFGFLCSQVKPRWVSLSGAKPACHSFSTWELWQCAGNVLDRYWWIMRV